MKRPPSYLPRDDNAVSRVRLEHRSVDVCTHEGVGHGRRMPRKVDSFIRMLGARLTGRNPVPCSISPRRRYETHRLWLYTRCESTEKLSIHEQQVARILVMVRSAM